MDQLRSIFEKLKENPKVLIIIFVTILIAIPSLTFLLKYRVSSESSAFTPQEYNRTITQQSASSSAQELSNLPLDELLELDNQDGTATSSAEATPTPAVSFGPTLGFQLNIQGRPGNNQGGTVFMGISTGAPSDDPEYLLTFTVTVPKTGIYTGLSLAGLNVGEQYTAYVKGSAQIATSSAFIVNPFASVLNSGLPLSLVSGDLNEDNVINNVDYNICVGYYGLTTSSPGWNENIDLNKDGIINTWDVAIILSNMNRVGAGDVYSSTATNSASLNLPSLPQGGIEASSSTKPGYWMWVPDL